MLYLRGCTYNLSSGICMRFSGKESLHVSLLASSFEVGLSLSSSMTSENNADTIRVMVTLSRVDNEPFVLDRSVTLELSSSGNPGIVGEFSLVRLLPRACICGRDKGNYFGVIPNQFNTSLQVTPPELDETWYIHSVS